MASVVLIDLLDLAVLFFGYGLSGLMFAQEFMVAHIWCGNVFEQYIDSIYLLHILYIYTYTMYIYPLCGYMYI